MDIPDKAVAKTGYLVGNTFTLADINLLPIIAVAARFPEAAAALAKRANLKSYLDKHIVRASV